MGEPGRAPVARKRTKRSVISREPARARFSGTRRCPSSASTRCSPTSKVKGSRWRRAVSAAAAGEGGAQSASARGETSRASRWPNGRMVPLSSGTAGPRELLPGPPEVSDSPRSRDACARIPAGGPSGRPNRMHDDTPQALPGAAGRTLPLALTFDDVLIVPGFSDVHPAEVSLRTTLCEGITLNMPLLSAAMDTVTEARLAIALAQEGGIGVVHKNLSIDAQAHEVDRVKRSEAGMIVDPVTMRPQQSIRDALGVMATYKISGVPVTDERGRLVGILTNRDLRWETELDRPISDLMTREDLVKIGRAQRLN